MCPCAFVHSSRRMPRYDEWPIFGIYANSYKNTLLCKLVLLAAFHSSVLQREVTSQEVARGKDRCGAHHRAKAPSARTGMRSQQWVAWQLVWLWQIND